MKNKMEVVGNIYVAGVYGMRTKQGKWLYVGSSIQMNDAMSRHLHYLKRGLYAGTNKGILQREYDNEDLIFEVIKESSNEKVENMTIEQKEDLQKALSVLENFYIKLYRVDICNAQNSVTKHSSNRDARTSLKRSYINRGSKNPNSKYNEKVIAEILWLKLNTNMKNKDIANRYNRLINRNYISRIGIDRYIYLQPVKPNWYTDAC